MASFCHLICFLISYLNVFVFKKIRTLIKFIDLKWGTGRGKPEKYPDCSLIFIDNNHENFFEQIRIFFESGFLNKDKTVLIVKFYKINYLQVANAAEKHGVKVVFYLFYRQIPSLDGRVIFYPYNAQSNCRLILNRNARHIFLTHGESNKKASVNRMVRLYDYVLAAGEISRQRYLESGIFSSHDLDAGRVIRVGSALSASCFEYLSDDGAQACIAYMPTWEGGLDNENFSSIASQNIAQKIIEILNGLGIHRILIKLHPNTGCRIKFYKNSLALLAKKLMSQGIDVHVDPSSMKYLKSHPKILNGINKNNFQLNIKYGIADVSAAEFMLAAKKIPTIVFLRKKQEFFASSEYLKIRRKAIIDLDGDAVTKDAIEYLKNPEEINDFLLSAFEKESYLDKKNAQEISKILISKFKNEII